MADLMHPFLGGKMWPSKPTKNYGNSWKIMENHMFLMGKSTISMAMFNSKLLNLLNYQRVDHVFMFCFRPLPVENNERPQPFTRLGSDILGNAPQHLSLIQVTQQPNPNLTVCLGSAGSWFHSQRLGVILTTSPLPSTWVVFKILCLLMTSSGFQLFNSNWWSESFMTCQPCS